MCDDFYNKVTLMCLGSGLNTIRGKNRIHSPGNTLARSLWERIGFVHCWDYIWECSITCWLDFSTMLIQLLWMCWSQLLYTSYMTYQAVKSEGFYIVLCIQLGHCSKSGNFCISMKVCMSFRIQSTLCIKYLLPLPGGRGGRSAISCRLHGMARWAEFGPWAFCLTQQILGVV